MKKNSYSGLTVGIDINQLEEILLKTIPRFSSDRELVAMSKSFKGLSARYKSQGRKFNDFDLIEILNVLDASLDKVPSLPTSSVAQIHTYIGHIKALKKQYGCAIQSFLKALWILTSKNNTCDTPPIYVALTTHHLGLMYGHDGNLGQAISLLERAMRIYKQLNVKENSVIYGNALSSLKAFRDARALKFTKVSRFSLSMVIYEETEWTETLLPRRSISRLATNLF